MSLATCRILRFTLTFLCADLIHGARPVRDFTDGGRALEVNREGRQDGRQAEVTHEDGRRAKKANREDGQNALDVNHEASVDSVDSAEDRQGCPVLKEQLEALGFRGDGDPCRWNGIRCSASCTVTSIYVPGSGQTPSGNILAVKDMTELKWLDLGDTAVTGDLAALSSLTELEYLSLENTGIAGDVASLEKLEKLRRVYLEHTRVTGDVASALSKARRLDYLRLEHTRVTGDLRGFRGLSGIRVLGLRGTGVLGDVTQLGQMKDLEYLDLSETEVGGDLAAVRNLTQLKRLLLSKTKVEGDVSAVRELQKLTVLKLSGNKVHGNISAVKELQKLTVLKLSGNKVHGNISAVKELQKLTVLELDDSKVSGEISAVVHLNDLETLNLARTAVTGWITADSWNGHLQKLREINVAETALGPVPVPQGEPQFFTDRPLLPALQTINVSGCKLDALVEDFFFSFAQTGVVAIAASGCRLRGAMPDLRSVTCWIDGGFYSRYPTPLAKSLQVLDISDNNLTSMASLPAAVRLDLRGNHVPLTLDPSVVREAVKRSVDLWLDGTKVANPETLKPLLGDELHMQPWFGNQGSFACRDLVESNIRVTPRLFVPEVMCQCEAGHEGFGIACWACPSNTYAPDRNMRECLKCPQNSTSQGAATSWQQCLCAFGSIHQDDRAQNALSCQCPAKEALVDIPAGLERCESCHKLRLECPVAGSHAATAPVKDGFIRLQPSSHEVFQCLDLSRCNNSACVAGYDGVLCSDCADNHRSSKGECKPCTDVQDMSAKHIVTLALCSSGMLVFLGAAWTFRHRFGMELSLPWKCAAKLLLPQLAILLQLMQLWSVLGQLQVPGDSNGNTTAGNSTDSDSLVTYMEALQLTSSELQGFFALQCIFHGASVRLASAIATPLAPLIMLLVCCFVEVFFPGAGIQVGLKILTVLFIGGAAGSAQLLGCQRTDGTGEAALHDFSFRPLAPHLRCTDAMWVDWIAYGCAVFYGVVIPSFLAFLFAKQHVVMRQSKTFMVCADGDAKEVMLQLHVLSNKECLKEDAKQKRLVAAAAAYVAVHVKKDALVSLKDDAVTVQIKQDGDSAEISDAVFSVDDLVQSEDATVMRNRAEILRYNALVQMLAERAVLADIQSNRQDRVMMGARELLCKYVNCGFVWLEVCLKLASAALVSVVGSKDGFWLSVAITLGMALVVGLAQPFMQPQLNALQTCCFVCLSMAAVGFHVHRVWWLSRVALALPVLLLALLLLRPDSKEALALRLQEELEKKLPEGPVEVSAEQVRFV